MVTPASLSGWNVAIGEGHIVSAAWATLPGASSGRFGVQPLLQALGAAASRVDAPA